MPYAHPDALVGTEWLAAHLDDPHVRVLDCSFKLPGITPTARADYDARPYPGRGVLRHRRCRRARHQPAAHDPVGRSASRKDRRSSASATTTGSSFTTAVGLSSAGRAWWMLRLFGHDNVALLDGGLPKWRAEGPAARHRSRRRPPPRRFTARFDPALVRDKAALLAHLATGASRSSTPGLPAASTAPAEETRPGLRRGHIPGSRNLPFDLVTDPRRPGSCKCRGIGGAVRRGRRGARPADRDKLRLRRHRLRARLRAASDRPCRVPRSMTGRGRNGACRAARRSRPARHGRDLTAMLSRARRHRSPISKCSSGRPAARACRHRSTSWR